MAITVTTPATERDLTTMSAVKDTLNITDDTQDALVEAAIKAASAAIEGYCQRTFAKQTYEETVEGHDHPILMVTNTPIIGTPTVTCEGDPVVDFTVEDAEMGTLYRKVGWLAKAWIGWDVESYRVPGTEVTRYTIEYEAGYTVPGEDDHTLPADIEQAALLTAADWVSKSYHGGGEIKSKKVGDLQIDYQENASIVMARFSGDFHAIPATARSLLSVRLR
jgi:uncharacterized phiE125 gp8 family phage protein